jgi:hypothetical protein
MEATSAYLTGVPVATHIDGTSAINNTFCAVLFFDEQNYTDAVVLAIYPNGSQGVPTPPPGRTTFIAPYQQINSAVIASGSTSTYTVTGGAPGIPLGALAVVYKAFFTSPTAGASIHIAPHSGAISSYATIGNLPAANATLNGVGIVPVDASGQIDIKANTGNCTVTLYTYGYIF